MLLYPLPLKAIRCWCLDLTVPPGGPGPCVYALVVPAPPPAIYIGATKNLRGRVGQHLSRARTALRRGRGPRRPPQTAAAALLRPVIAGRSGLLVIRLEASPPGDAAALQRLELCWLLVAAREELPVARRRGPRIQWSGDPGELRAAFRLARTRRWPGQWIRALRPLCDNRALPERSPRRQAASAEPGTPPPWPAAARPGIPTDSVNGQRPRAAGCAAARSRCEGKKPGIPRGAAGRPR